MQYIEEICLESVVGGCDEPPVFQLLDPNDVVVLSYHTENNEFDGTITQICTVSGTFVESSNGMAFEQHVAFIMRKLDGNMPSNAAPAWHVGAIA